MDSCSSFNVNDDARNPCEDALNSTASVPTPMPEADKETPVSVNIARMVANAYVKG